MLKINPAEWMQINAETIYQSPKGRLRLRITQPAEIYIIDDAGEEAFLETATQVDLKTAEVISFRVKSLPEKAQVFLFYPERPLFEPDGEVYTNTDLMPSDDLSGMASEMRLFRLETREAMRQIRQERDALSVDRQRDNGPSVTPDPVDDDETDETPDPQPAPAAKVKAKADVAKAD